MKNDGVGFWGGLFLVLIGIWVWDGLSSAWHSKFRYSSQYGVQPENVFVDKEPTDCNFMRAPLGTKDCHYERIITARYVRTEIVYQLPVPTKPCEPNESGFTSGGSAWMWTPQHTLCLGPTFPADKVAALEAQGFARMPNSEVEAAMNRGYVSLANATTPVTETSSDGQTWVPDDGDKAKSSVFVTWQKIDD
jgi:hypothetical protein